MATLRRRPGGSDDDLRREIVELEEDVQVFLREHPLLKEDAHERIDQGLAECLARAEQLAAEFRHRHGWPIEQVDPRVRAFGGPWPETYATVGALHHAGTNEAFARMLHDAVDAEAKHNAPAFSKLSRKQFDAKLRELREAIEARQWELARREVERRREELEAELADLDGAPEEQRTETAAV